MAGIVEFAAHLLDVTVGDDPPDDPAGIVAEFGLIPVWLDTSEELWKAWIDGAWVSIGSSGNGAEAFLGLTDTPADYTGHEGKVPVVNAGEDALVFADGPDPGPHDHDFTDLDDTPGDYTGHGEKAVAVNSGETALEFVDFPSNGNGSGTPFKVVAASDAPSGWGDAAAYTCDGDDDHVEINQAISDMEIGFGGQVLLSPGTFHPSAPIELRSHITLKGQGPGVTTVILADDSDVDTITNVDRGVNDDGVDRVAVLDLTVDGNALEQNQSQFVYGATHAYLGAIRFANVRHVHVENVHAINATGYGVEIKNAQHVTVWRCETNANGDDGISVTDYGTGQALTRDVHVFRCVSHDNGRSWYFGGSAERTGSGFEADDGPTDVIFEECVAFNNGGVGFETHRHIGEQRLTRITFRGCITYDNSQWNTHSGFRVLDIDGVTFEDCTVLNEPTAIVINDNCTDVLAAGLRLEGEGVGINLLDGNLVEITDSILVGFSTGIQVGASSSDVVYTSTRFIDCTTDTSGDINERYGEGALADTVESATEFGIGPLSGTSPLGSRADHQHGTPDEPEGAGAHRLVVLVPDNGGLQPLEDDDGFWLYGAYPGPTYG